MLGAKIDFTLKFDLETLRLQAITRNSGSKVAGPRHNSQRNATKRRRLISKPGRGGGSVDMDGLYPKVGVPQNPIKNK